MLWFVWANIFHLWYANIHLLIYYTVCFGRHIVYKYIIMCVLSILSVKTFLCVKYTWKNGR